MKSSVATYQGRVASPPAVPTQFSVKPRCLVLCAVIALSLCTHAHAGINQFVSGMIASGSAPFSIDDTSATDNNIRTHDYATYRVGYSTTPSDPQALIKLTVGSYVLPPSYVGPALTRVAFFDPRDLPTGSGGCQNITVAPLTALDISGGTTSGVTPDGQTIYCVQPNDLGGNNLDFRLQIRGNAPNGTVLNPPVAEFSSTSNPATTALTGVLAGPVGSEMFYGLPPLTIKASPKWNLVKTAIRQGSYVPGSGPPGTGPGGVGGANGFVFSYAVGFHAIGTRKGLEALSSASFTDNWNDPDFPNSQLVTWPMINPGFVNTDITPNNCGNWQSSQAVLGNVFDNAFYTTVDAGNSPITFNGDRVANGGTCQSTAVNQVAKTANFQLVGTDWSLTNYPIRKGQNPAAQIIVNPLNPDDNTNEWWAANKLILIWVPETDIPVPPTPNTQFLTNTANFAGLSVSGQPNVEPTLSDNVITLGATRQLSGGLNKVAKPFFFINNPLGLDLPPQDPVITSDAHVNQISPNQAILMSVIPYNNGTTGLGAGQVCDKIDNSRFTFIDTTSPSYVSVYGSTLYKDPLTGIPVYYYSGSRTAGPAFVFELGISNSGLTGGGWTSFNSNNNEYAGVAQSGSTQADTGCGDADATWYPSVAALLSAGKSLQQITTVRGKYNSFPGSAAVDILIPLLSRGTYAYSGTDIGTGGGSFAVGGSTVGSFSSNQARWNTGIPGFFGNAAGVGRATDSIRFFQTEYVRISKTSPTNPDSTLVTPGSQVTYALNVNLTTGGSAHTATISVWDVLPANLDYTPASSTYGGAPLADPVCSSTGLPASLFPATVGPPASAAGQTPAGYKACLWTLVGQNVVKTSIGNAAGNLPELRFRATLALSAPVSPPVLLNTSYADTPLNNNARAIYGGAQVGFRCNSGENCYFSNWSLSVAAAPGIGLSKAVSSAIIAPNQTVTYTIGYGAVGASLASPRILDVLPYVGDGRGTGSNFAGTFRLAGPVVIQPASVGPPAITADAAAQVLYTSNAPININRDPYGPNSLDTHHILTGAGANSAVSTNWCTAAQFGTANCPATVASATGVLILPLATAPTACGSFGAVPCLPSGSLYQAKMPMVTAGNTVGNIYNNDYRADSPSLSARAPGSNLVTTRVVAPDLILAKTVTPSVVNTGATVLYTLSVKNNTGPNVGIVDVLPAPVITVTDNLPANMSIASAANVNGGAAWNCAASTPPSTVICAYTGALPIPIGALVGNVIDITAVATSLSASSLTVVNTATISMTGQTESPSANNTGTATMTINPTFSDPVSIVSLPVNAPVGSVVSGTVVFANIASGPGSVTATNASGTVTLSNGQVLVYPLGDLAPGVSVVQTFTTTVPGTTALLVATSNITSGTADSNPTNNSSTASLIPLISDVSVTLALPSTALAGTTVTATVTYTNLGNATASSVVSTVSFSNGQTASFSLGNVAPGQTVVTTTVVLVPAAGNVSGTATVVTVTTETTLTNNLGTATLSVGLAANLSVTKDNGSITVVAGGTTTYTVTFANGGPSNASGAVVKDASSAGLVCVSVTCVDVTGGASCPASMLPQGTAVPAGSTAFFAAGVAIPAFPANSTLKLSVLCNVVATGL